MGLDVVEAGIDGEQPHSLQAHLSASEAERLVESLRPLSVEQVGSEAWQDQHDAIVALNVQAHHNAAAHSDEFVKEALVLHDRMRVLVFDLLSFEAWKQGALPLLWGHLAAEVDSVEAYQLLYHEAALTNLLEVTLFHADACEALGEDAALELVDWAARRMLWLASPRGRAFAKIKERSPKELLDTSAEQQLQEQAAEIEFSSALCALTILRYLTDRMKELPLSVAARLVSPADAPALLAALLSEPPWERRRRGGKAAAGGAGKERGGLQRFEGGAWQAADRLRLSRCDIQAWLALGNLLLEPATRGRYDLDAQRTAALLRLRRLLHEAALEQLPVARDIARLLDSLEAGQGLQTAETDKSRLIMEQVPVMRQAILDSVHDWSALAARQQATVFAAGAAGCSLAARRRRDKMLAAIDFMCGMGGAAGSGDGDSAPSDAKASKPALDPVVRITAETQLSAGVCGDWASYTLQLDADVAPEPMSVPGLEGGPPVSGLRHRLKAVSQQDPGTVLPSRGRISVAHGARRVQAKLALPAAETREAADLAEVIWLTAGRLGVEGLALQLKLQKVARCSERDKASGTWHAYRIVGGACTVAVGVGAEGPKREGGEVSSSGEKRGDDRRTALNF